jgi:hypothetical protein
MKSWLAPALLTAVVMTTTAQAQTTDSWDPGRLYATRAQLEELLRNYEQAIGAQGYSAALRADADDEAGLIRSRLLDGDFQLGDQITLTVGVQGQQTLTGTFTVAAGRVLTLPELGDVPLTGLLRSELKQAITDYIAKYVRNPQVQVQTSIRLAIFGEIGNPGYHIAPAENLLTDVLMAAGGPTKAAKQKELRIRRGDEVIWDGEALQAAIVQGRTLDQLNLRAGDEIEIPGRGSFRETIMYIRWIPFTIAGIVGLKRLF